MTLGQKQRIFARLVGKLIRRAYSDGFELSLGEAHRPRWVAEENERKGKGSANSLHVQKLAIDLNLFRDGVYQRSTAAHRPLGEWWETQSGGGVVCCWGGRFGDGNHYSLAHLGRK